VLDPKPNRWHPFLNDSPQTPHLRGSTPKAVYATPFGRRTCTCNPWGEPRTACLLPDDYLRKLKGNLAEAEATVESETRVEPDPDAPPPSDDDQSP